MKSKDKFQNIVEELKFDLKMVDDIIIEASKGKASIIADITNYLVSSGGKRVRPILLILAAKLCNYKGEAHYNLAAAIELIHTATLLHDDVVDNSSHRRSQKTVNAIWDNKPSILVGDFLFSLAFKFMTKNGDLRILKLLSDTSNIIADGEILQLVNSSNINLTKEQYFEIIADKTAILFSAATETGALIANKSKEEVSALREFGKNLGIIFQIVDDVLDYSSTKEEFGKNVGDDFFEGKVTLPIIIAFEMAEEADKERIRELFEFNLINEERNKDDFVGILQLLTKYDVINAATKEALCYRELCLKDINIFPDSIYKQHFVDIIDYCLNRIN